VERVSPLQLWSGRKEERESMRFMLKFRFPTDQGNALAKEGRLG
jgi:hypothetical protein